MEVPRATEVCTVVRILGDVPVASVRGWMDGNGLVDAVGWSVGGGFPGRRTWREGSGIGHGFVFVREIVRLMR